MAWNEPGGGKDPWGNNNGNRGNNNRGDNQPPDIDEAIKQLMDKLNKLFGGKGGNGGDGGKTPQPSGGSIFGIALIFGALFLGFNSYFTLDEKEQGVVLRLGKFDRVVNSGLHFKWPLLETLTIVETTTVRNRNIEERMLTKDNNIIEVDLNLQYRVSNPIDFALRVKDPELTLTQAAKSALRHVVGSTAMDPVLTSGREVAADDIKVRLQEYLDDYKTGIQLTNVNIKDARPPAQVKSAFDDVQAARQDKERYISEAQTYSNSVVPAARGKALRQLEEANAYKEQVIARAQGEANRFLALYNEYRKAPKVTRERLYIDAITEVYNNSNKVLVDVEGGNNMMYLPLDKIVNNVPRDVKNAVGSDFDISEITDGVINELKSRDIIRSTRGGR